MSSNPPANIAAPETRAQNFERVLSTEPFTGLKAIFDKLTSDREAVCKQVSLTKSYEDLIAGLGYKISLTPQIHIQDCYSRLGPAGGLKAVLPYYDIPTQSSLPTLVGLDSTVITTPKAAAFFNKLLAALKTKLSAQP